MKASDLNQLNSALYINFQLMKSVFPTESDQHIKNRLSWFNKNGLLIRLKRDFYITKTHLDLHRHNLEYFYVLGCALKPISYISFETVLRSYDVLTEATYGYQLATLKTRVTYSNSIGSFYYRQISADLFTGYQEKNYLQNTYLIATKSKALFDWCYYRLSIIPQYSNYDLVEDLRLNLEEYTAQDYQQMYQFAKLSPYPKAMKTIIQNLEAYAPHH